MYKQTSETSKKVTGIEFQSAICDPLELFMHLFDSFNIRNSKLLKYYCIYTFFRISDPFIRSICDGRNIPFTYQFYFDSATNIAPSHMDFSFTPITYIYVQRKKERQYTNFKAIAHFRVIVYKQNYRYVLVDCRSFRLNSFTQKSRCIRQYYKSFHLNNSKRKTLSLPYAT